jgi:hypothetical protein
VKRRHNHVRSQWIAAGISLAAVMVMLAPLRQGPAGMSTQHASFIPLLAASGVAETDAFRRLTTAAPQHALAEPQVRTPDRTVATAPRAIAAAAGTLTHDFQAPRVRWHHLDADQRAALDALSDYGRPSKVELAVLIDRGHREMPIQADFVGISLATERLDHVVVSLEGTDGEDKVLVTPRA